MKAHYEIAETVKLLHTAHQSNVLSVAKVTIEAEGLVVVIKHEKVIGVEQHDVEIEVLVHKTLI